MFICSKKEKGRREAPGPRLRMAQRAAIERLYEIRHSQSARPGTCCCMNESSAMQMKILLKI